MSTETQLKPCPFCGEKAFINREPSPDDCGGYFAFIECKSCHARSPSKYYSYGNDCPITYESLRITWNTRSLEPADTGTIQDITRDLEHLNAGIIQALAEKVGEGSLRALMDVVHERYRQISVEGWTPEHDDTHSNGEMALAAASYAYASSLEVATRTFFGKNSPPASWPENWHPSWWKPTMPRRDLVKAAALLLAEIERLDRADKGGDA